MPGAIFRQQADGIKYGTFHSCRAAETRIPLLSISAAMRDTSMILCLVCSPPPAESSGSSSGNSARPFARIDTQPRLSLETYRFFVSGRKA